MPDDIQIAKLTKISLQNWAKDTDYDLDITIKEHPTNGKVTMSVDNLKHPITYNFKETEFVVYKKVFGTTFFPWKFILVTQGEKISDQFKHHIKKYNG